MPPTEQDLKLLGVSPERITAALEAWDRHPWSATSRTCKCGLHFEASLSGHEGHATHRMAVTLKAGEVLATPEAVAVLGFGLEKRAGTWVLAYSDGSCRPAQNSEVKLWEMLIETIEKLQTGDTEPFCDECSGPHEGWLMEQYGGHWDTCPNRAKALPPEGEEARCTCTPANRRGYAGVDGEMHKYTCPLTIRGER